MARLKEEWRVVEGYPDYSVSNLGEVKKKRTTGKKKLTVNSAGYRVTSLTKDGKKVVREVNRIVANEFIKKLEDGETVIHKDGNKRNNKVNNLEVSARSFITENDLEFIRQNAKKLGGTLNNAEIARMYNVSTVAIFKIVNGQTRKGVV